jgi:hypothetical protein
MERKPMVGDALTNACRALADCRYPQPVHPPADRRRARCTYWRERRHVENYSE